jgi:hypothetical protein
MKHTFYISFLVLAITFLSCKKNDKKEYQTTFSPPATHTPEKIQTLNENNGNVRVYKVTLTKYEKLSSSSVETSTVLSVYNCTSTILGDTLIQGNIPGKRYYYDFGGFYYPIRAYSFYKDSLWQFVPYKINDILTPIAIKMPQDTTGKQWIFKPAGKTNNDQYKTVKYTFDSNSAMYGYQVSRTDGASTSNPYLYSSHFVTKKGIPSYDYNFQFIDLSTGGYVLHQYAVYTTWSNF